MPPDVFACPQCGVNLKYLPDGTPGTLVECPRCEHQFPMPAPEDPSALTPLAGPEPGEAYSERPQTPPPPRPGPEEDYTEGRPEPSGEEPGWQRRPSEDLPEYGEPRAGRTDLSSDYTIDISEWFRYAKMHYGAVLGPMVGFTLLYLLIAVVLALIPCGGLVQFFIDPPLQAGLTLVCLHQLRGKGWTFGDFFSGFQWYGSLLGNHLLTGLLGVAILLPGIVFVVVASNSRSEGLVAVAVVFAVANALVAVYVALRLALFSTPLIVDRGFGAVEAMQGSWALTQGHFLGLFGVVLLLGLINLVGALLCFVGLLFTMPFTSLAMTAGYLLIANSERPVEAHDFQEGRPV